ncbi:MAG: YtxH domain-containing protein [Bergeyella sp.]
MGNKGKGLLALLGLGALAFWKYKNSTPEEQQAVKDKINTAKDNLTKFGNDLKDKANEVVSQVQNKANDVKQDIDQNLSQN